jgi:hypothetical protein
MSEFTDLCGEYIARRRIIDEESERLYEIQRELELLLEHQGAETRKEGGYEATVTQPVEWDRGMFDALWEFTDIIPVKELEAARIPAKTIPATWDMRYVKPLVKYGSAIHDLIERSRKYGKTKLTVKEVAR